MVPQAVTRARSQTTRISKLAAERQNSSPKTRPQLGPELQVPKPLPSDTETISASRIKANSRFLTKCYPFPAALLLPGWPNSTVGKARRSIPRRRALVPQILISAVIQRLTSDCSLA